MISEWWLNKLIYTKDEVIVQNVTIIGVPNLDIYKACLQCKARVEPLTPPLGRCSRGDYHMLQRYDIYGVNTAAKLFLADVRE